jgi:hypothetical protein
VITRDQDDRFLAAEVAMNATNGEKPRLNLRDDTARCEMCISLAARAGVRIPEDTPRAVNYAREDLEAGKFSPERESAFYNAMAYIVANRVRRRIRLGQILPIH